MAPGKTDAETDAALKRLGHNFVRVLLGIAVLLWCWSSSSTGMVKSRLRKFPCSRRFTDSLPLSLSSMRGAGCGY